MLLLAAGSLPAACKVLPAARLKRSEMPGNSDFPIPVLELKADSYGRIGHKIGEHFKGRIQAGLEARAQWVKKLTDFAEADPSRRFDPFLAAVKEEFPHLVEELEGVAQGAAVPFRSLFTVALNPELSTMMKTVTHEDGCTTVAMADDERVWVGHNEDGNCSYQDLTYLLDVTWPSGVKSLCFSYPGYFPGNGPTINSPGVAQTVNYIGAREVRPGIPRYVIDRAIMEAGNLEEAVRIATHPRRAYSQHHLLLSAADKRIVSVETSPSRHSIVEVKGIFTHANHFIHPDMEGVEEFDLYKGSSLPRQQEAERWARETDLERLQPGDLMEALTSHANYPLSICRHPAPRLTGCTLGAALIQGEKKSAVIYASQPCQGIMREFERP